MVLREAVDFGGVYLQGRTKPMQRRFGDDDDDDDDLRTFALHRWRQNGIQNQL